MLAGDSFPRNPLTTTRLVVLAAFVSYPLFLGIRRVSRRTRDPPPLGLVDIFPSEEECEKLNEAGLEYVPSCEFCHYTSLTFNSTASLPSMGLGLIRRRPGLDERREHSGLWQKP